jgi:hypothetical protein
MFTGQLGTLLGRIGNFVLGFPLPTVAPVVTPMATVNIQSVAGFPTPDGGTENIGPINVVGTITPQRTFLNLASGNNAITVPANSVGVVITPPAANVVALKYKTTSGDVGINIPQGASSIEIFDPSNLPATIYLNAASLTTGNTALLFF